MADPAISLIAATKELAKCICPQNPRTFSGRSSLWTVESVAAPLRGADCIRENTLRSAFSQEVNSKLRSSRRRTAAAAVLCAIFASGAGWVGCGPEREARAEEAGAAVTDRTSIVAMARLEPKGRVVKVSAAIDDIIRKIEVSDGTEVKEGQILVTLDGFALRSAEREEAELALERIELTPFEIEAQKARIRLIRAELDHARRDVEGQRSLIEKGFTPGKEFEEARLRVRRHEEGLNEAQANLKKVEAGLDLERREGQNALGKANSELERSLIRAPIDGRILKVLLRPGERTGGGAVIHMGKTSEMYALAEVHATDIRHVYVGQRARFESSALSESIEGTVEAIGSMIYTNNIFGERSSPKGVRVFQVHVRLDDSEAAAAFTNLEGQVRIFVDGSGAS